MTFRTALSGLTASNSELSVIANNIANVNTVGFKGSRAEFANVFAVSPYGVSRTAIGSGVRVASVATQMTQGNIEFTNNNLDMAISGDGFFRLSDRGAAVYSRAGNFSPDRDGFIVNPAGHRLQAYPTRTDGNGFDTGRLTDLQLVTTENPPRASSGVTLGTNLPADATAPTVAPFDAADARTYNHSTSLTVYDSLGVAHVASFYYVKTAGANAWELHATLDGNTVAGPLPLEYDTAGVLVTPAGGTLTLPAANVTTGADPITLTVDLAESTQYGESFAVNGLSQDGYTTGRLTTVDVSPNGIVFARFTNGQSTPLGQVALARFPNSQGLQILGDNVFGESFESGQPILGEAGTASLGLIQSGALEGSNVDLTAQLVSMIQAQRNFQANAQMISTQDQITQTVINIR